MLKATQLSTKNTVYVVRRGPKNWRVCNEPKLRDESRLVPASDLRLVDDGPENRSRIVPLPPLLRLYELLRGMQGSAEEKFRELTVLGECCGLPTATFLAELVDRSIECFARYANPDEDFVTENHPQPREGAHFAAQLVHAHFLDQIEFEVDHVDLTPDYVDYEMRPRRTTRSCYDDSTSAANSGDGGMDLFLSRRDDGLPIIGEIKASTENVGPTFALIQTLVYATELVTASQWERLNQRYEFEGLLDGRRPQVDIYVYLESKNETSVLDEEDQNFMIGLARGLIADDRVRPRFGRIVLLKCTMDDGQARCRVIYRSDRD